MRFVLSIALEKVATHPNACGSTGDGCHQQSGVFTAGLHTIFWDSLVKPQYLLVFTPLAPEQEKYLPILQATLER